MTAPEESDPPETARPRVSATQLLAMFATTAPPDDAQDRARIKEWQRYGERPWWWQLFHRPPRGVAR